MTTVLFSALWAIYNFYTTAKEGARTDLAALVDGGAGTGCASLAGFVAVAARLLVAVARGPALGCHGCRQGTLLQSAANSTRIAGICKMHKQGQHTCHWCWKP